MNRKWLFSGIFSLLAVCCLLLPGCPMDEESPPPDVWTPVGDLSEIEGRWEGSSSFLLPEQDLTGFMEMPLPAAPLDYLIKLDITGEDVAIELIIDYRRYLETVTGDPFIAEMAWTLLQETYNENLPADMAVLDSLTEQGIEFTLPELADNYKMIIKGGGPLPEDTAIPDGEDVSFSLNQNKTKLKLGIMEQEIILNKK